MKKNDYSGKNISSHEIWEKSLQDEKLDKKGGAHAKEGSKADYKADEKARKAHNKALIAKKGKK